MLIERVCQFTTIIFACNILVVLVVALATDYWEYREFKFDNLIDNLPRDNKTVYFVPGDTKSYIILRYFYSRRRGKSWTRQFPGDEIYYEPPTIIHRFYQQRSWHNSTERNHGTHNVTQVRHRAGTYKAQDMIILYRQSGNLFRDCETLEVGVRKRLRLTEQNAARCSSLFALSTGLGDLRRQVPVIKYFEMSAFLFTLVTITTSFLSISAGAYAAVMRRENGMLKASVFAIVSAISLVVTIGLFHVKCHLTRRRPWMGDLDLPYRPLVDEHRFNHYGWSFVLAWLCVPMECLLVWAWLSNAQDLRNEISELPTVRNHHRLRSDCSI